MSQGGGGGFSVLRTLRLLRIMRSLKVIKSMDTLKKMMARRPCPLPPAPCPLAASFSFPSFAVDPPARVCSGRAGGTHAGFPLAHY